MVPTAQLRMFAPLDTFPPRERERWAMYAASGGGLTRAEVAGAEAGLAAARLVGGRPPLRPDVAIVRRAGSRVLICPLQLELRAAHAFAAFRRTVPDVVVGQFVPEGEVADPTTPVGGPPHILDEPWAVPLHWFVAFDPDERRLLDPPEGVGPHLRYLTTVALALGRVERAITIVESTVDDGDEVLLALAELAAWLDAFDRDSVVELDYGRLVELVPPDVLRDDHTCAEVHNALEALACGDLFTAAATYGACRARWSHQRAREHAS